MHPLATVKLGKLAARHDPRTLQLKRYLAGKRAPTLPVPPPAVRFGKKVPDNGWGMMLNDRLGICTISAVGHARMAWTADTTGTASVIPDSQILKAYEAVGGYVPGRPDTDQGCVMLDVLNYWRQTGIGGDKIGAFAQLPLGDHALAATAHYLFRGLYVGIRLPLTANTQINAGQPWTVVPDAGPNGQPGSWGGHCVEVVGVDPAGLKFITWGMTQWMSWRFYDRFCDESYATISQDYIDAGKTPSGFSLAELIADLPLVGTPRAVPAVAA